MVKVINKSVCRGVAGKRAGNVKGVVIHNDAGAVGATAESYVKRLESMTNKQLENGFAHYYIDRNTVARVEDTYNKAWHTANQDGNANYIGYEVCQSLGASDKDFLANEQATFKQVAEDLKFYGLKASRDTVRLHREFVATACPHRSWELHGKSINSVKDYFIAQINKYMNEGNTVPKAQYYNETGWYEMLKDDTFYTDKSLKTRSGWTANKGSKIAVDEVVSYGATTRGVVQLGKSKRYITLNKSIVKKTK
ncbi:endolysin [Brochothrix phage NF5]|uniref:endolysin n=1 Tax=Brochothrix phage NF5 TaxID=764561 RepID=UPI0001D9ACA2|nr:endolysin [Brochothrix phage NF5]ADH03045.1 gp23 [Brochothrix phage NF5]